MASTKGLPVEIFLQLYGYLGPKDFNAARRTCRAWMRASLDRNLLGVMLERGGWTGVDASREWPWLSCQLARECALAPGRAGLEAEALFTKTSETDFTRLKGSQPGGELIFTTSACSRFLCVARGALIHTYRLDAGRLVYMARVECQGRVLAMTMGLHGGRYAMAAILEGRVGMVRKLPEERFGHGPRGQEREQHGTQFNAIHIQSNSKRISIAGTHNSALHEHNLINQTWNGIQDDSTTYSDLGSQDDPPRSVALCPQSQCVVFGCSAGLDVQWTDETSGESLHRWFPLACPSDHVYFLPSQTEDESSTPVGILSSPAHPQHHAGMKRRLALGNMPWWGSHRFEGASLLPSCTVGGHCYNVSPLPNGHHVLFVHQPTHRLVLGTNEPRARATRLVAKIHFIPPTQAPPRLYRAAADVSEGARIVAVYGDVIMLYSIPPHVYRSSLANEPTDCPLPPGSHHWLDWWEEPRADDDHDDDDHDHDDHDDDDDTAATLPNHKAPAWPLSLRGARVATLANVCEIGVQTSPCLSISAFTDAGKCELWEFPTAREAFGAERKTVVCQSGLVESTV